MQGGGAFTLPRTLRATKKGVPCGTPFCMRSFSLPNLRCPQEGRDFLPRAWGLYIIYSIPGELRAVSRSFLDPRLLFSCGPIIPDSFRPFCDFLTKVLKKANQFFPYLYVSGEPHPSCLQLVDKTPKSSTLIWISQSPFFGIFMTNVCPLNSRLIFLSHISGKFFSNRSQSVKYRF